MPQTIDALIDQHGITVIQLAERSGLPAERVDAIVNGRWTPSPAERAKLVAALGVPVDSVSWGHTMSPRNVRYHRYGLPETNQTVDGGEADGRKSVER